MENRKRAKDLSLKLDFERMVAFARDHETPCLIVDLKKVDEAYTNLENSMPTAKIFFAMKACPLDEVLQLVANRGGCFDAASRFEMLQLFNLGVPGSKISYGNTIKKEADIAFAYKNGVRIFTTDSKSDIEKLARRAPGSKVNFRILTEGAGADWPLSKKFGSHPDMAYNLAIYAKELGLDPYGIAFHVGSQQRDIGQWDTAISQAKYLFDALEEVGIILRCINIGGGFPAQYIKPTRSTLEYGTEVTKYLFEDFKNREIDIIVEPGRSLTADAGIIAAEVVMISRKSSFDDVRWLFLDIGKFSGLPETQDESIKYPIIFPERIRDEEDGYGEVIIAGNTCDSADILYEDYRYLAPMSLEEGDLVYLLTTGAYTSSYSAIGFNGFPPLRSFVLS